MKPSFNHEIRIRLYKIVIAILIILIVSFGILFYKYPGTIHQSIFGGLVSGLIVALLQYLLDWNEHREIETFSRLGIKELLSTRDNKPHYQTLIEQSHEEILVLGNTASRLLEDFAHESRDDSRAMLDALSRGVKIRFLLPSERFLDIKSKPKRRAAGERINELKAKYDNFQVRYFSSPPAHSLMRIDNDRLVGPIFPGVQSKDSPTIHVYAYSAIVKEYLIYFERLWNDSSDT